jgi:RimJ/RimL family protein N-acetyltransferase
MLTTARLVLRPFRQDDVEAYAAMCADPEVMRYLGTTGVLSRDDAWRQMAMLLGHWELRGFGMWALEEQDTGRFVGRVGLHEPEGWPDREVGWVLARAFWGRGLAFEAAEVALEQAFSTYGWTRAISLIDPANARSIRLAERLGERLERTLDLRGHRVNLYAVTATEWRRLQAVRTLPQRAPV